MHLVQICTVCTICSVTHALRFLRDPTNTEDESNLNLFRDHTNVEDKSNFKYALTLEVMLKSKMFTNLKVTSASADTAFIEVGCGKESCQNMMSSLRSFAIQNEKAVDTWAVVDNKCSKVLDNDHLLAASIKVNKLNMSELSSIGPTDLFRACASSRLWLPSVLTQYKYIMYVDSDTLITDSVKPILQIVKKSESTIFMTEEVNSKYCQGCGGYAHHPGRNLIRAGVNGYNSGFLGINVDLWNKQGMVQKVLDVIQEAKKGKVKLLLGDQDILNWISRREMSILHTLPCECNMRADSICKDASGYFAPIILHGNRNRFASEWKKGYSKLVEKTNAILSDRLTGGRGTNTSLWKAFNASLSWDDKLNPWNNR